MAEVKTLNLSEDERKILLHTFSQVSIKVTDAAAFAPIIKKLQNSIEQPTVKPEGQPEDISNKEVTTPTQ